MTRHMRKNDGLITLGYLTRVGFSRHEVAGLVAHGDLRHLHRGVYADGRAPLRDRAYFRAALLSLQGDSWLRGRTAAMVWALEAARLVDIEVGVVATSTPKQKGLRITRTGRPPHPSEIRSRNGLRVSSIPRLLIETAADGGTADHLHRLIENAVRRNLLDIHDLAETLERNTRRPGTVQVHKTCEEYLPHLDRKSGLERAFDRWLAKHPEIPLPRRNIKLGFWEIDCYWPEHRLALELDGRPYHTVVEDIERDRRKDAWLQVHGNLVLRVTDSRFRRDKPGVYRDLTTMLALGEGRSLEAA
jgi:Protein of unknown function (DUF559)